jgi:hypothetical protein
MDINQNFAELDSAALEAYATEVRSAFDALVGVDAPTVEQVTEAETYAEHIDAIKAEQETRVAAAAELAARAAALRTRFSEESAEEAAEEAVEAEAEETVEAEVEVEEAAVEPKVAAKVASVATLAAKTGRPAKPAATRKPVAITAAADVPDFATGSHLGDLSEVAKAVINRMRGFGRPTGDGRSENLQHFGVASFHLDFPKELSTSRGMDDMEVLTYAASEKRLPGGSLVASGGWCAPSETIYDLCGGETLDGILSIPEVNVTRGGIKFTKGPSFADIYNAVGFCQTEAQAIAGTDKTCVEVPCPQFEDVRLDACGLCVKAPILTNASYPELVERYISGSMVAHQHKMNAKVLTAMATEAGAALVIAGLGTTAGDTLGGLELIADGKRSDYRLGLGETLEVVVPHWVKGAIRTDLAQRSGQTSGEAVTDEQIRAHFAARHLNVQFVYDWQSLASKAVAYPATFNALIYPAGTYVKGMADVINLNAVYDAASLVVNIYTALFFEQGILVANMCYDASLVTLPVCNSGRTGAGDLTCDTTP